MAKAVRRWALGTVLVAALLALMTLLEGCQPAAQPPSSGGGGAATARPAGANDPPREKAGMVCGATPASWTQEQGTEGAVEGPGRPPTAAEEQLGAGGQSREPTGGPSDDLLQRPDVEPHDD